MGLRRIVCASTSPYLGDIETVSHRSLAWEYGLSILNIFIICMLILAYNRNKWLNLFFFFHLPLYLIWDLPLPLLDKLIPRPAQCELVKHPSQDLYNTLNTIRTAMGWGWVVCVWTYAGQDGEHTSGGGAKNRVAGRCRLKEPFLKVLDVRLWLAHFI